MPETPRRVGPWELLDNLGQGQFAEVTGVQPAAYCESPPAPYGVLKVRYRDVVQIESHTVLAISYRYGKGAG